MERDYADKGVQFVYAYKALAHPEWNGYVRPFSIQERLMHVAEAKRTLGSRFTWICDTMDEDLKNAFGRAPNSEWLIDPEGVVVARRDWSSPEAMRGDLAKIFGAADPPTRVEDLDMPVQPPPKAAASGVVPRIEKPRGMRALRVEPTQSDGQEPFYAKLRVEGDRDVIESGKGQLYLRFGLDPLYNVHWNNLTTAPISVKVEAPEGVTLSETVLTGPELEVESDIDPREFLLDLSGAKAGSTMTVSTHYFVCNDDEGWCKPIEQSYVVKLERDPDGGSVISPRMRDRMEQMMEGRRNRPQRQRGGTQ